MEEILSDKIGISIDSLPLEWARDKRTLPSAALKAGRMTVLIGYKRDPSLADSLRMTILVG